LHTLLLTEITVNQLFTVYSRDFPRKTLATPLQARYYRLPSNMPVCPASPDWVGALLPLARGWWRESRAIARDTSGQIGVLIRSIGQRGAGQIGEGVTTRGSGGRI